MGSRTRAGFGAGVGQVTSSYSAPNLTGVVYDPSGTGVVGASVNIWKSTSLPVDTTTSADFTVTSITGGAYSQDVAFTAGVTNYWAVKATISSDVTTTGGSVPAFSPVHFDGTATVRIAAGVWKTAHIAQFTVSAVSSGAVTALTANTNARYEPGLVQTLTRTSGAGTGAVITATAGSDGALDAGDYTITNGGTGHSVGTSIFTSTRKTQRFLIAWRGKLNTFSASDTLIQVGPISVQATGGNTIRVTSGSNLLMFVTVANANSQHNEFQVSIDLSQPSTTGAKVVVNGAAQTPSITTWVQNAALEMVGAAVGVGNNSSGGQILEHELDYAYFASGWAALDNSTGQLLDLSVPSNVARFGEGLINQATGAGPTGRTPELFAIGPYTSFDNKGGGNAVTVTGTLTAGS